MKARILVSALAAAALVAAPPAAAKGPESAKLEGAGLAAPLTFTGHGEPGGFSPFSRLVDSSGLFAAAFSPGGLSEQRPEGATGPSYTLTFAFMPNPARNRVRMEVYPYAQPPMTYTKPDQRLYGGRAPGGWYVSTPELRRVLVAAGLPRTPPAAAPDDGFELPQPLVLGPVLAAALGLAAAAALLLWRRRPVTAR